MHSVSLKFLVGVLSFSDYYPFGMQMVGRNGSNGDYRYGFQGQETDDEITGSESHVSYKYRMHDARLGRFFAVDPLTSEYPHYTPYSFSGNRVIDAVELEGLEEDVLNKKVEVKLMETTLMEMASTGLMTEEQATSTIAKGRALLPKLITEIENMLMPIDDGDLESTFVNAAADLKEKGDDKIQADGDNGSILAKPADALGILTEDDYGNYSDGTQNVIRSINGPHDPSTDGIWGLMDAMEIPSSVPDESIPKNADGINIFIPFQILITDGAEYNRSILIVVGYEEVIEQ
jgi:RHS repeat-associated protein